MNVVYLSLIFIFFAHTSQCSSPEEREFGKVYHELTSRLFREFGSVEMSIAAPKGDKSIGILALRHNFLEFPNYVDGLKTSDEGEILTAEIRARLYMMRTEEDEVLFHPNSSILKVWFDTTFNPDQGVRSKLITESLHSMLDQIHRKGIAPFEKSLSWTRDPEWGRDYMNRIAKAHHSRVVMSRSLNSFLRVIKK